MENGGKVSGQTYRTETQRLKSSDDDGGDDNFGEAVAIWKLRTVSAPAYDESYPRP